MRKSIITAIAVLFISFTFAQKKILFKVNPTEGKTINYEMVTKMDVEGPQTIIMDMNILMSMTPTDISESGLKLTTKTHQIKMDMNAGIMNLTYDSSKEPSNQMEEMFAAQFKQIMDTPIISYMDRFGNISNIDMGTISAEIFDDSSVKSFAASYPSTAISMGDSWSKEAPFEKLNATAKTVNTFEAETDEGYKIKTVTTLINTSGETMGTISGFSVVDPKTFLTIYSSSENNMEVEGAKIKSTSELKRIN